jgi:hypothetical protein
VSMWPWRSQIARAAAACLSITKQAERWRLSLFTRGLVPLDVDRMSFAGTSCFWPVPGGFGLTSGCLPSCGTDRWFNISHHPLLYAGGRSRSAPQFKGKQQRQDKGMINLMEGE